VIFVENYHVSIHATAVAEGHHQGFPGVRALENVQLDLWPGKVTALIGENGAGKSTLVKVMTGIYQPEEGEILYKAIPFIRTPESAHKVGITAIHQETVLFDELSVRKIFSSASICIRPAEKLDWPAMHRRASEISPGWKSRSTRAPR
jgi:rhamnose transport system ATP-binding protein